MEDYAIQLESISKVYKLYNRPRERLLELIPFWKNQFTVHAALNNVTINVKRGQTLGVIGKNGAGKSTLLKIITGVTVPTSGIVQVSGEVSALLELGTGFNPEYNGVENIYLNGTIRGISRKDMKTKMRQIISFADIGSYINQPVKTYSSGMFARLAFAVIISFKPEILIIDEALSVGDVFFQQKCNAYMKNEMRDVTKILVSHDMRSITSMCDQVVLLDQGRLVKIGSPLEVVKEYTRIMHTETFSVASDSKQLNNLPVTLDKMDDWTTVRAEDIGGAGNIRIERVRCLINREMVDLVTHGDQVELQFYLVCAKEFTETIFGYTFKDKYGNSIFAQSTAGAHIETPSLVKGRYFVKINFAWPEVKEGDYFLTLGVGEGSDEMTHIIQCWAHNVLHLTAFARKHMHGIINHTIDKFLLVERE